MAKDAQAAAAAAEFQYKACVGLMGAYYEDCSWFMLISIQGLCRFNQIRGQ